MQVDQFSSYKTGTGYDTIEAPFVKKASNKMFMSPEIETKGMQSNGSFSKLRPDSSQSFDVGSNKQSQGMKSPSFHERAEQPQSTYHHIKEPSSSYTISNLPSQHFTTPSLSSPKSSEANYGSFSFPQTKMDPSIQLSLLKIQKQSLKQQNLKLSESVKKLRSQLEQKVSTLTKFNQLMKIKYSEIKQQKAEIEKRDLKIKQLEQEKQNFVTFQQAKRLKQALFIKTKQLDELNEKINNLQHENFHNQIYQTKINKLYDQLDEERSKTNASLIEKTQMGQKISSLEQQVSLLQFQLQKKQTFAKVEELEQIQRLFKTTEQVTPTGSPSKSKQSTHYTAFQQALRVQMKRVQQLKQVIQNNQQIIQKLRDNLITSRKQLEQLKNQMKIMDLKANSQRKKLIMQYRLQLHEKDNQLNSAFKKYKTLEDKYKNSLQDIKAKDEFFRQHLVGRTTEGTVQQYIEETLKRYTESFEELMEVRARNDVLSEKLKKYEQYEQVASL